MISMKKPFIQVPIDNFTNKYSENINYLSSEVKNFFDNYKSDEVLLNYPSFLDFDKELNEIADELCDWLSVNVYGCYLYVDKVYIYRTIKMKKRNHLIDGIMTTTHKKLEKYNLSNRC